MNFGTVKTLAETPKTPLPPIRNNKNSEIIVDFTPPSSNNMNKFSSHQSDKNVDETFYQTFEADSIFPSILDLPEGQGKQEEVYLINDFNENDRALADNNLLNTIVE